MKTLEKSQDKIQKICSILRDETLKPAQEEARKIIQAAEIQAEKIIEDARKNADKLQAEASSSIEQDRAVFQLSLQQAAKQSTETLRQNIENRFFNHNLTNIVEKSSAEPALIAKLINAIIVALEKEGLGTNLTALVPKTVTPGQINELLLKDAIKELKEGSVVIGDFGGGVKIRLNNKNVVIDISNEALVGLLTTHITRKDFRKLWFES